MMERRKWFLIGMASVPVSYIALVIGYMLIVPYEHW